VRQTTRGQGPRGSAARTDLRSRARNSRACLRVISINGSPPCLGGWVRDTVDAKSGYPPEGGHADRLGQEPRRPLDNLSGGSPAIADLWTICPAGLIDAPAGFIDLLGRVVDFPGQRQDVLQPPRQGEEVCDVDRG